MLRRVHIENYRSIENLTLELGPVTLLVGPNGAGKSNLVDAILLSARLTMSGLRAALAAHGRLGELAFVGTNHAPSRDIALEVEVETEDWGAMTYGTAFILLEAAESDCRVTHEWLSADGGTVLERAREVADEAPNDTVWFTDPDGYRYLTSVARDRLALPLASMPAATALSQWMARVTRYDIDVASLRSPQQAELTNHLSVSAANLAHVWLKLERDHPALASRVVELLRQIVPDVRAVRARSLGRFAILEADLAADDGETITLDASGLSDGTLRALALLVAVYQPVPRTLVVIEEPETGLHPHAAGLLFDALLSAPNRPQLLFTTHSPHILDADEFDISMLRVVEMRDGATVAGPVASEQLDEIRHRLTTGAELLAENALHPELPAESPRSLRPAPPREP